MTRAERRARRSPLLALPSFLALKSLDASTLEIVGEVLTALRNDAAALGGLSWKARKAPMGAYWMSVAAHTGAALRALQLPTTTARATRADRRVNPRNPVLALAPAPRLAGIPPAERRKLRDALARIREDAGIRANTLWPQSPDRAAYWRAAAVYTGHLRRAVPSAPLAEQTELLAGV
jgi:hypothetical protein